MSTETGFTPAFFLVLELLLFIIIFLAFLIRWYLSASILSDPERALGAPRSFLDKKQREGKTGNSRPNINSGLFLRYGAQQNQKPTWSQNNTACAKQEVQHVAKGSMWGWTLKSSMFLKEKMINSTVIKNSIIWIDN